jgi:hypothetical protein
VGGVPGLPEEPAAAEEASSSAGPRRHHRGAVAVVRQLRHGWLGPGGRGQQLASELTAGHSRPQAKGKGDAAASLPSPMQERLMLHELAKP